MPSANASTTSIYAHVSNTVSSRSARQARRARAQARLVLVADDRPALQTDRLGPVFALLRTYREGREQGLTITPLAEFVRHLEEEVLALESWAERQPLAVRRGGPAIRHALELLRVFGRMTALDFSSIPDEERRDLVNLLALEHRWCYAAAGTSREIFKVAIGRTGAR